MHFSSFSSLSALFPSLLTRLFTYPVSTGLCTVMYREVNFSLRLALCFYRLIRGAPAGEATEDSSLNSNLFDHHERQVHRRNGIDGFSYEGPRGPSVPTCFRGGLHGPFVRNKRLRRRFGLPPHILPMAFPPASPSLQLEERLGLSRTPVQDISLFPERRSEYEKGNNDVRYTAESRSQLSVRDAESCGLSDLVSADVWRSRAIWRAGVSDLESAQIYSTDPHFADF